MSYLERLCGRPSRRRPAATRFGLEALEGRTLLSGTAAEIATPQGKSVSVTALTASLPTAVTGAEVTFTATVTNTATGAPVTSGHVTFVINSPEQTVLGTVNVTKSGQAAFETNTLTQIGKYQVVAEYGPTNPVLTASTSAPTTVQVIPQPVHVPTTITIQSGAPTAESRQQIPLIASVKDAGTGNQVDAGKVQPISGTIEFFSTTPQHIFLGQVTLDQSKTVTTTSSIQTAFNSAFGLSSSGSKTSTSSRILIVTNKLREVGPYQIEARFIPSNDYFTASTSSPQLVTITPTTRSTPTVTSLQVASNTIETGETDTLTATVQDPSGSSTIAGGYMEFFEESPHPVLLGKVGVAAFDQPVSVTTDKLQSVGDHQVRAVYVPGNDLYARSASATQTVTVTPLTAASFRVRPVVGAGVVGEPMSFTVTALNAKGQPVRNYTGTVTIYSPTDSLPNYPSYVYSQLNITPLSPTSPDLATISPTTYTFTTADQGTHTFDGVIRFGKGGAEKVQVSQTDDPKVHGKTTFAIA